MTYSTTKIRTPNWAKARQKAYEVLKKHNIQDFPINIVQLIKRYTNIKIFTYKEFSSIRNVTVEDIIKINSSEDGCIHYYADKDRYLILYNDEINVPERIYWTLAHEFGHYMLEHHKESERSELSRLEIKDEEYDLYELEADFFARFLINPPSIIKEWNVIDIYRVMNFFKVSFSAANNTITYLRKIAQNGWTVVAPDDIKKQLEKFILSVNYGKTCTNCNSFFVYEHSNFCPCCRSTNLNNHERGADFKLKYPGVEVDHNGRAKTCPVCNNEELEYNGDYCNVCSAFLINKCADVYDYNDFSNEDYLSSQSCGTLLSGNARYCHKCGNPSTYLYKNYLNEWNHNPQKVIEAPF